jgi:hypothetical protein
MKKKNKIDKSTTKNYVINIIEISKNLMLHVVI